MYLLHINHTGLASARFVHPADVLRAVAEPWLAAGILYCSISKDIDAFAAATKDLDPNKGMLILIDRQGRRVFLALNP